MRSVSLAIPEDVFFEISSLSNRDTALIEKLQSCLAIGLFVAQEVSLSKAAQLSGQNIAQFMDTLNEIGIPSINYTEEMLADDLEFVSNR